jgi:hypothetical protein
MTSLAYTTSWDDTYYIVRIVTNPHRVMRSEDAAEYIVAVTRSQHEAEEILKLNPHFAFRVGLNEPSIVMEIIEWRDRYVSVNTCDRFGIKILDDTRGGDVVEFPTDRT